LRPRSRSYKGRTRKTMIPRLRPSIVLLSLFAAAVACTGGTTQREEQLAQLRSERRILLSRFSGVQNVIRGAQKQALLEPGVRQAQEAFNRTVREVIARDDPASLELLDRARAVGHDLESMANPILLMEGEEDPRPTTPEERAAVAEELATVERELRPVLARAFQDTAVAGAFSTLRDSVIAAILRIDPGTQRSMDLMAEIESQVAEIDAEIARLSE
jgi:hypothetical protein